MKQILTSLAFLSVFALAPVASAQVVYSYNLTNGANQWANNSTLQVGALPAANWNFLDTTATATWATTTASLGSDGSSNTGGFGFAFDGGTSVKTGVSSVNQLIQRSMVGVTSTTTDTNFLTLQNTNALTGGQDFDLYLYLGRRYETTGSGTSNGGNLSTTITMSTTHDSYGSESMSGFYDTARNSVAGDELGWVEGGSPLLANSFTHGPYMVFRGLSATTGDIVFSLTASGDSVDRVGIGAFQIVAVPEPTTWALLAGGLTTLMVFRRRRN